MKLDIPYPELNVSNGTVSVDQVNEYLYKLAESLEFALGDINMENLSDELLKMIGAGINEETVKQYAEDALRSANSFARRIVKDATLSLQEYADDAANAAKKSAKEYADEKAKEASFSTDSPYFTGIPTAPTADAGTNTGQIATTAFVQDAVRKAVEDGVAVGYTYTFSVNYETGQLEYEREE